MTIIQLLGRNHQHNKGMGCERFDELAYDISVTFYFVDQR